MPTFIRPSRVIVEECGRGLTAAVIVAAAATLGALAAVLDDIVITLAAMAVAGSAGVLAWVLRSGRGSVLTQAPRPPTQTLGVTTEPRRPAIEPRRVVPGTVIRTETGSKTAR